MKTANITETHCTINEDDVVLINLGRKHHFNVLHVVQLKETEKAIQFGSITTPRHTIWFPKKALRECKEVPGVFNLAARLILGVRCSFLATCGPQCLLKSPAHFDHDNYTFHSRRNQCPLLSTLLVEYGYGRTYYFGSNSWGVH